jgi:hypothetical protein
MLMSLGLDTPWSFLQYQWKRSLKNCLLRPFAAAVRMVLQARHTHTHNTCPDIMILSALVTYVDAALK